MFCSQLTKVVLSSPRLGLSIWGSEIFVRDASLLFKRMLLELFLDPSCYNLVGRFLGSANCSNVHQHSSLEMLRFFKKSVIFLNPDYPQLIHFKTPTYET